MLRGRIGAEKVSDSDSASGKAVPVSDKRKDAHTYDKGYKRWEKFDVEAELAKIDADEKPSDSSTDSNMHRPSPASAARAKRAAAARQAQKRKPAVATHITRAELDKQDGNKHFRRGEFPQAIKCYTRCIAANPRNAIVYSNRAQAHIKLKNFLKAEEDCTSAIAFFTIVTTPPSSAARARPWCAGQIAWCAGGSPPR